MKFKYCRLCLEPENPHVKELTFILNLCFCNDEGNLHRKCLKEWIEKTGIFSCDKCHCRYDASVEAKTFLTFLSSSKGEIIKMIQKIIYFADILHLSLITIYVYIYLDNIPFCPYRIVLLALTVLRTCFNFRVLHVHFERLSLSYTEWKRQHYSVTVNND